MKSLFPRPQLAAGRLSRAQRDRWRPPTSAAFLSTSQPMRDDIKQAHPLGPYYDLILANPLPYASQGPPSTEKPPSSASSTATSSTTSSTARSSPSLSSPSPSSSSPSPSLSYMTENLTLEERKRETASRAKIVFGSRLAGPAERAERLAEIRDRSKMIAGVLVPPRPEEPENCCMSGCVNCVWDRFRDEMEEWAHATAEASKRLKAQEGGVATMVGAVPPGAAPPAASATATATSTAPPPPQSTVSMSMDDDGGGSESNWSLDDAGDVPHSPGGKKIWNEDLYQSVPVGIREFMKQEKRLKLKHEENGTVGG